MYIPHHLKNGKISFEELLKKFHLPSSPHPGIKLTVIGEVSKPKALSLGLRELRSKNK